MAPPRPRIGLNTTFERDAEGGLSAIRPRYWQAILRAGGLPYLLPQLDDPATVREALAPLDGFVMIGGCDIAGERFGQPTLPTVVEIEPERECADFALLRALIELKKPTLAVCLGFQELNLLQGGTLYQDVLFDGPDKVVRHYAKVGPTPRHRIDVRPGSLLARAMGVEGAVEVNSTHHQAIAEVGRGLEVDARAPDGIVEAFELTGHPFCLGVQWHPEQMTDDSIQRILIESLVEAARTHR